MGLIENLERPGWQDFLSRTFDYTLAVLATDRFRRVGSSADDLRAWLTAGGISRVKQALDEQMEARGIDDEQQEEVRLLVESLIEKHRRRILGLTTSGVIPADVASVGASLGISLEDMGDMLTRMQAGERPFEDWMRAHGHSDDDIAHVYKLIDDFLVERGVLEFPPPPWEPDRT